MADLSSPPSPASTTSEMSKLGLNPSSPLYLYQIEQLKLLHQRSQELLYQNPSTIQQIQLYAANPTLWWQQLIFSLPPAFGHHLKQQQRAGENFKQESSSPQHSPRRQHASRDYLLTPETPEHDESYETEMDDDQPLNLSKKDHHRHQHVIQRETDIISSSLTPRINSNLFSAIWSPASLVSSASGFKSSESVESSPTTPKLQFNFENVRGLSVKRENMSSSPSCDFAGSMKRKPELYMNNNNNNLLTFNNNLNLNSTFHGIENVSMSSESKIKVQRKSLPSMKPDSTEHSDYVVHEYRDERGKKERSFEVRENSCDN